MKKALAISAGLAAVALAAFGAFAAFGDGTTASAQSSGSGAAAPSGSFVAVAIGQLHEDDGEEATVDLHASSKDGTVNGAFRFYSEEYGYYNGGVKTLTFENGVIHVTSGGGLFLPDGRRVQVRYDATFSTTDNHAVVTVTRPNGTTYTMSGEIDGLVTVQAAPVRTPAPVRTGAGFRASGRSSCVYGGPPLSLLCAA